MKLLVFICGLLVLVPLVAKAQVIDSGPGGGGGGGYYVAIVGKEPKEPLDKAWWICTQHMVDLVEATTMHLGDFPEDWRDCSVIRKKIDARGDDQEKLQAQKDAKEKAKKQSEDKRFVTSVAQSNIK